MKKAYFAGPITQLPDESTLEWYEAIGKVLEEEGYSAFIPHRDIHSPKHVEGDEVYEKNIQTLEEADLLVAYVGTPSLGVGITIERAKNKNVPMILMSETGVTLSEMLLPMLSEHHDIRFENKAQALEDLRKKLQEL